MCRPIVLAYHLNVVFALFLSCAIVYQNYYKLSTAYPEKKSWKQMGIMVTRKTSRPIVVQDERSSAEWVVRVGAEA